MTTLLLITALQASTLEFNYASRSGMSVSAAGIPIVRGSTFQYYEPGWSKGYYSAAHNDQKVERVSPDLIQMTFRSPDGRAQGSGKFTREGNKMHAEYSFGWLGDKPVNVELMAGFLWAPAFQAGSIQIEGNTVRYLAPKELKAAPGIEHRRFGPDSSSFRIHAPIGSLKLTSDVPFTMFDARGYDQPFAQNRDVIWYGILELQVPPKSQRSVKFTFDFTSGKFAKPIQARLSVSPRHLKGAQTPAPATKILLPKPQVSKLDWRKPVIFDSIQFTDPSVRPEYKQALESTLMRRFQWQPSSNRILRVFVEEPATASIEAGFSLDIQPGRIKITSDGGIAGIRSALHLLGQMAFAHKGMLALPAGKVESRPATHWRGVHLFIGPTALQFHKELWTRVLLPMGFNKVVLQCERTEWESMPNLRGGINMKRADLAKLCDWYRSVGVEPIPLVQSFGHAEWVFAGGANRDLAFNSEALYAVDPRKPKVKEFLDKLWSEIIDVTKARTVHFGLDEVDMVGFPHDPALVTELWKLQLGTLTAIANRHRVQMMLWGDKGLAPGEAIDAALGDDPTNAAARRAAIPVGAFITDWHYKADPDPSPFMRSLLLWEREGFQPIASTWYEPNNIRGFVGAATAHGFGVLQTTWAGYESSELAMLRAIEQFSAMILTGDYAWSGRQDAVDKLGYDAGILFQSRMYGQPQALKARDGWSLLLRPLRRVQFQDVVVPLGGPISLGSTLTAKTEYATTFDLTLKDSLPASEVALAVDTEIRADVGDEVGAIEVITDAGTHKLSLRYGFDVRATHDLAATGRTYRKDGLSLVRIRLPKRERIRTVRIVAKDRWSGLQIHGVTIL